MALRRIQVGIGKARKTPRADRSGNIVGLSLKREHILLRWGTVQEAIKFRALFNKGLRG